MRIGPDGLPQPWAAEKRELGRRHDRRRTLRAGMKWHDGKPVTVDDVMFSFEAPAGDKAPMYKPFVANIAGDREDRRLSLRIKLKQPERRVPDRLAGQDQPDPQAHLGADARRT